MARSPGVSEGPVEPGVAELGGGGGSVGGAGVSGGGGGGAVGASGCWALATVATRLSRMAIDLIRGVPRSGWMRRRAAPGCPHLPALLPSFLFFCIQQHSLRGGSELD